MTVTMEKEHLTEDLLKRLLASSSVESYLDAHETVNTTLTEFLRELIDARNSKGPKLRANRVSIPQWCTTFSPARADQDATTLSCWRSASAAHSAKRSAS